jgi:hypothetical protein
LRLAALGDSPLERLLRPFVQLIPGEVRQVLVTGPAGISRRDACGLAGSHDELVEEPCPDILGQWGLG